MDTLYVKDLEIFAHHGVFPEEKALGQKFVVSLKLSLDMQEAALTGDLSKSVHYGELCHQVELEFQREKHDLIETAGEQIADYILENYDLVKAVTVLVKKPWAPIHRPLDYAAIEVSRAWHRAFIGFGSNLGDKEKNIQEALALLEARDGIKIVSRSSIIETEPWGYENQDNFLNGVVEIKTWLSPRLLMQTLFDIEAALKRERTIHWGPRTLDLDILFYDDVIDDDPVVTLPHPRIQERLFVLEPLAEIAPNFIHPVLRKSMAQLAQELSDREQQQ
ncbi:MAG: 2-amino-4-hydroxy-6-hydroxymethyldihydropteridine diphosphokinase [Eubacterium sp.]|nr:2-amino-4-hydroxy-6-hydroxymethyldihydropteridine diphosphokinase [Eubacterium sp.]